MFADVRLLQPQRGAVVTVPQTAIMYNPYGDAVFVVLERDGAQVVEYRQVHTGMVRDGRIEVSEGLQAGERVVSAGQLKLRNGMTVSIDDSVQLDGEAGGP